VNDDFKMILCILVFFGAIPLLGMALSDWHEHNCKVELAKSGRSVEEIKEICK